MAGPRDSRDGRSSGIEASGGREAPGIVLVRSLGKDHGGRGSLNSSHTLRSSTSTVSPPRIPLRNRKRCQNLHRDAGADLSPSHANQLNGQPAGATDDDTAEIPVTTPNSPSATRRPPLARTSHAPRHRLSSAAHTARQMPRPFATALQLIPSTKTTVKVAHTTQKQPVPVS